MILSCVRSVPNDNIPENPSIGWLNAHLGVLRDYHQLNVALTRARKGLIIIGLVPSIIYFCV